MAALLGMFAKHWRPGTVKTRLAATLGEQCAAAIHQAFVETLLRRFETVADRRVIAFAPEAERSAFAGIAGDTWELMPQSGANLGERLERFFEAALRNNDRVVVIGSDSPDLPAEILDEAFTALASHEVVLGPSADGGYYLVGARGRPPSIFTDIAWSTWAVWPQTVARLTAAGVPWFELPPWYDVDDEQGLNSLLLSLSIEAPLDPNLARLKQQLVILLQRPAGT